MYYLWGRRRCGGGPLAAVPSGRAPLPGGPAPRRRRPHKFKISANKFRKKTQSVMHRKSLDARLIYLFWNRNLDLQTGTRVLEEARRLPGSILHCKVDEFSVTAISDKFLSNSGIFQRIFCKNDQTFSIRAAVAAAAGALRAAGLGTAARGPRRGGDRHTYRFFLN